MAEASEITTRPALADITRELVQPPSRVYVTLNDRLYIRSRNSLTGVTLRLAGRLLTAHGEIVPFNFEHTPATDRTASIESFQLAEGYLLAAAVFPSAGAPVRGETFVELGILRGLDASASVVDVLAKDYLAEAEPIAFPGSPIRSSLEGRGNMRSITGTDPAAGVEVSETVPTDARWRLNALRVIFVADGTAASRVPRFDFDDGSTAYYTVAAQVAITAGQTAIIALGSGMGRAAGVGTIMTIQVPDHFFLLAAHRIQTVTASLQAGDNYGAPQLYVEEWLQD